jgi:TPR repeat protein
MYWYNKAAEQGDATAQFEVAIWYATGEAQAFPLTQDRLMGVLYYFIIDYC